MHVCFFLQGGQSIDPSVRLHNSFSSLHCLLYDLFEYISQWLSVTFQCKQRAHIKYIKYLILSAIDLLVFLIIISHNGLSH